MVGPALHGLLEQWGILARNVNLIVIRKLILRYKTRVVGRLGRGHPEAEERATPTFIIPPCWTSEGFSDA